MKNKFVCGIWLGKSKPTSDILFSCLMPQLDKINRTGVKIVFESMTFNIYFGIYGLVADTPAKSLCMYIKNFNGAFGCPYCLNPGTNMLF